MALEDYRSKSDFNKTPEPSGEAPLTTKQQGEALFFCLQKHLASHLHDDLRLKLNGVLLSWAVPKGPSLNPADKRLAMQTEDHPYDYGMFEGVIPEGDGAGIVMLWDYGTWEPEPDSADIEGALRKGELKFRLDGYKLKGSWVLIKTQCGGAPNSWLLIKHRDDWSGPTDIAAFAPLSVKTPHADFAEILSERTPELWTSNPPAKSGDTGAMFRKIIERALTMKAPSQPARTAMPKAKQTKAAHKRRCIGSCIIASSAECASWSGEQPPRQHRPHGIRQPLAILPSHVGPPAVADHHFRGGIERAERPRMLVFHRIAIDRQRRGLTLVGDQHVDRVANGLRDPRDVVGGG